MNSTAVSRQVRRLTGDLTTEAWGCLSALVRLVGRPPSPLLHGVGSRRLRPGAASRPPVLLVHGLAADRSCFSVMEDRLHRAGYTTLSTSYSCRGADIEECARALERDAAWLLARTGSDRVHVVAHSLGGVVLRWAATHTRMRDWVDVAVTLGSPHRGTPAARLAPRGLPHFGRIISQLRPGALDVADAETHDRVRWVTIAAERDFVVPVGYAALPEGGNVRNAVVRGGGHMNLTTNPHCLSIILQELAAAGTAYHVARPVPLSGERKDVTMTTRERLTDCSCGQPIDPFPTTVAAHCRRCGRAVRRTAGGTALVPAATTPTALTAAQAA
jgi:triacylglycerol lipase